MNRQRITSRVLIVLVAAVLSNVAATAMADSSTRRQCREMCSSLIQHGCRSLFHVRPRCRARILRQCRRQGPAACELSRVCTDSCTEIVGQCFEAKGSGAAAIACAGFAYDRCEEHGPEFCANASSTVNGCNRVAAEDHRGEAMVTVTCSRASVGYDYAPECIIVSAGATVRFEGPFAEEPLIGGQAPMPDPDSPFMPPTTDGTARDFVLATPGVFPYFGGDFDATESSAIFALPWGAVIVDDAS